MREDMDKVIVERPRKGGGSRYPRPSWRADDSDLLLRREGMKRPWMGGYDQKRLNENLAPLRRFLRSNVGRPWRKVHSEMRERINMNSAVQFHIWQHARDYVSENVVVRKTRFGVRYESDVHGYAGIIGEFVVDPRNGLLARNPEYGHWNRRRKTMLKPPVSPVRIAEGRVFKKVDDIWFEIRIGNARKVERPAEFFDLVTRKPLSESSRRQRLELYGNETWYAKWKQQIGKREIKRLGLNDEPKDK